MFISIIVPALNEAALIQSFLRQLRDMHRCQKSSSSMAVAQKGHENWQKDFVIACCRPSVDERNN